MRPPRSAAANRPGDTMVQAAAAIAIASTLGRRCSARCASTCCARRLTSRLGMSMRTGHASNQAPQRLEAYGRLALSSTPVSSGDSTAPIGPGYTDP